MKEEIKNKIKQHISNHETEVNLDEMWSAVQAKRTEKKKNRKLLLLPFLFVIFIVPISYYLLETSKKSVRSVTQNTKSTYAAEKEMDIAQDLAAITDIETNIANTTQSIIEQQLDANSTSVENTHNTIETNAPLSEGKQTQMESQSKLKVKLAYENNHRTSELNPNALSLKHSNPRISIKSMVESNQNEEENTTNHIGITKILSTQVSSSQADLQSEKSLAQAKSIYINQNLNSTSPSRKKATSIHLQIINPIIYRNFIFTEREKIDLSFLRPFLNKENAIHDIVVKQPNPYSRFEFGVIGSVGLPVLGFEALEADHETFAAERQNSEKGKVYSDLSFQMSYQFLHWLKLTTGISYARVSNNYDWDKTYFQDQDQNFLGYDLDGAIETVDLIYIEKVERKLDQENQLDLVNLMLQLHLVKKWTPSLESSLFVGRNFNVNTNRNAYSLNEEFLPQQPENNNGTFEYRNPIHFGFDLRWEVGNNMDLGLGYKFQKWNIREEKISQSYQTHGIFMGMFFNLH